MAMKNALRLMGAAIACGIVALALLPPAQRPLPPGWNYVTSAASEERFRLSSLLTRSVRAWRAASLRDSINKVITTTDSATQSAPMLLVDTTLEQGIRAVGREAIATSWKQLEVTSPKARTAVLLLRDSFPDTDGYGVGQLGGEGMEFIVPARGDSAGTCVSVLLLREFGANRKTVQRFLSSYSRSTVLGPCAFYAAFGTPGARIAGWLEGRRYDLAMWADWGPHLRFDIATPLRRGARSHLYAILGGESDLDNMTLIQRRCWLGSASACEALILAPVAESPLAVHAAQVFAPEAVYQNGEWSSAYREYLADMRHDIGAEKFEKFWTSNEEPAVAFRNATGETLGEWTHKWVLKLYGPTVAGAKVPASYFGLGLLFAVGCVSLAAAVASRRTVG